MRSENLSKENSESPIVDLGVVNATPAQFYQKNSCMVAYRYMRLEVTGEARACCIAKHPIGDLQKSNWREIWRSEAYSAFRSKMLRIHKEHFHLTDPEFLFCQQCSHLNLNVFVAKAQKGEPI